MATDIFLKPINRAAQVYTSGPSFQRTHRQQHQFILVYNLYTDVVDDFLADRVKYLIAFRDRLHFLCNQVESPKLETDQDVFNQYNRKRVINKKVTFSPVNVRMYDTHDGMALKFAKTLYEFEFQNARLYKESNEQYNYEQSVLVDDSQFRETHEYGMRSHDPQRHRLIKSIDLYQIAGGMYSKTRMVHPRLQRFDMDTFDFSSSQLVNVSLSFNYENLLFEEINVPIAQAEYDLPRLFEESAQGLYDPAPPLVNDLPEPPETKLERDVPTPPNTVTQEPNVSVPANSNNSPIKKEVVNEGAPTVKGLNMRVARETPEYQEILNELENPGGRPRVPNSNPQIEKEIQKSIRDSADAKYRNKVIKGEIDPPAEAKNSSYEITGSPVEKTVQQGPPGFTPSTSKSSVSNSENNNVTKKIQLSAEESASLGTSNPDQAAVDMLEEFYEPMSTETLLQARQTHVDEQQQLLDNEGPAIQSMSSDTKNQKYNTHENKIRVIDRQLMERDLDRSLSGVDGFKTTVPSSYGDLNEDSFVGVAQSGGRVPVGQIKDSSGNIQEVPLSEYKSLKGQLVEANQDRSSDAYVPYTPASAPERSDSVTIGKSITDAEDIVI